MKSFLFKTKTPNNNFHNIKIPPYSTLNTSSPTSPPPPFFNLHTFEEFSSFSSPHQTHPLPLSLLSVWNGGGRNGSHEWMRARCSQALNEDRFSYLRKFKLYYFSCLNILLRSSIRKNKIIKKQKWHQAILSGGE